MPGQSGRLDRLDAIALGASAGCMSVMLQAGQQFGVIRGQIFTGDGRTFGGWSCVAVWCGHGSISSGTAVEFGDKVFKGGFTVGHAQFHGIRANPHIALAEVSQNGFNTEAAIIGYVLDKDVG